MNKSNNILITGITGQDGIFLLPCFLTIQIRTYMDYLEVKTLEYFMTNLAELIL